MKKIVLLATTMALTLTTSAFAYDIDANSLFRANLKTNLKANDSYVLNCPSIINGLKVEENSNVKFFYLDNEPYNAENARGANRLIVKTLEPTKSKFEISMLDGSSEVFEYNIKEHTRKTGAIAGVCRIEL